MPVPASINDLSTIAGNNSPAGSESPTLTDDYLRALSSFIASLRDSAVKKDSSATTGAAKLPSGTTAQRPASPQNGMFRLNSETNLLEALINGVWVTVPHDKWLNRAIGEPFTIFTHLTGAETPPTNNPNYRYIKLTASDSYNAGVLTSESVSGSAPLVQATAVINAAGSPMNGQTVRLINTERRVIRAGSSGSVEADAFQGHKHGPVISNGASGVGTSSSIARGNAIGTRDEWGFIDVGPAISDGTNGGVRTANETRPKNIGADYFMRIR